MPQTKWEEWAFAVMMVTVMVLVVGTYNLAWVHGFTWEVLFRAPAAWATALLRNLFFVWVVQLTFAGPLVRCLFQECFRHHQTA